MTVFAGSVPTATVVAAKTGWAKIASSSAGRPRDRVARAPCAFRRRRSRSLFLSVHGQRAIEHPGGPYERARRGGRASGGRAKSPARVADKKLPRLRQHLNQCGVCREEYETLRDLVRLEAEGRLPSVDELRNSF